MGKYKNKIAFVVATKDRPSDLRKLVQSLSDQTHQPDQVIIVDSSKIPVRSITKGFQTLNIKYIYHPEPSAAEQRNIGIRSVDSDMALIGFLDDDVILEKQALEVMLDFWKTASTDLGGCAFNLMNPPSTSGIILKSTALVKWLGLYSSQKGVITPSGWQTLTGTVRDTIFVEWFPSGASMWRNQVLQEFQFDDWFQGYSYLEDLEFCYRVQKKYRMVVVSGARFFHYPAKAGREGLYTFGKKEVVNRIYFVKKHQELLIFKCYLALIIRMFITLLFALKYPKSSYFKRLFGNIAGLVQVLKPTLKG